MKLPTYIEIEEPVTKTKVEHELLSWGHICHALRFGHRDKFLCLREQVEGHHYILCNEDSTDADGCILHSQPRPLDTIGLMKFLGTLGYNRAVILEIEEVGMGHTHVLFCDNDPQFEQHIQPSKVRSEWPSWSSTTAPIGRLFPLQCQRGPEADFAIETNFRLKDVEELLKAGGKLPLHEF